MTFSTRAARWLAAVLALWTALPTLADEPVPALTASAGLANAGYFDLRWTLPERAADPAGTVFELQQAREPGFVAPHTLYRGPDRATVLSGQADGSYFFRVRATLADGAVGPWSEPVQVTVSHHPLVRAWLFFAVGAVVFLATLALVLGGGRVREAAR